MIKRACYQGVCARQDPYSMGSCLRNVWHNVNVLSPVMQNPDITGKQLAIVPYTVKQASPWVAIFF